MVDLDVFLTPEVTSILVALLAALCIGGVLYALFQPKIAGTERKEERLRNVTMREQAHAERRASRDNDRRRRTVQDQLKEFEEKQRAKQKNNARIPLEIKLRRAGLEWSKRRFWLFSLACAVVCALLALLLTSSYIIVACFGFVGFFGVPRWYVARRRNKRYKAFIDELPNAVDVIVRGTKAGLPLGECIAIVANEAREPIATEFRRIVETQQMGVSLTEAIAKLPERIPLAEANFLAIVVSIQQQAGGALSEALGNLARVLRARKTMKGKIQAMSMEAKSSAAIIGALPFIVAGLLYLISPGYIDMLFTETIGNIVLAGSAIWMIIGMLVMKKMINFDF